LQLFNDFHALFAPQEDYDGKTLRMVNEAVSVLLGNPLQTEQRLKLSRTELLSVMDTAVEKNGSGFRKTASEARIAAPEELGNGAKLEEAKMAPKRKRKDGGLESGDDDLEAELRLLEEGVAAEAKRAPLNGGVLFEAANGGVLAEGLEGGLLGLAAGLEEGGKSDLGPYRDSLEYLDDSFQVLALQMRVSKARHQEDLKEAGNAPGKRDLELVLL
jgi:hypothetical protein